MQAGKQAVMFRWLVFAITLTAPSLAWLVSVKDPAAYLAHAVPPGQVLYIFSKLAGLLAFFLFCLQALLALAHHAPVLRGFSTLGLRGHRVLGLVTSAAVLTHVVLFVVAVSLRTGSPAWNLLLPNFAHGYYNSLVSIGVIALWLLMFGVLAGWRASQGHRVWKNAHMVWFLAFGLAFLHAFSIGSESRYGAMRYVLLFAGASVILATLSRLFVFWRNIRRIEDRSSNGGLVSIIRGSRVQ